MRTYQVTITGKTPLLMHHDDIDWADRMEAWQSDPSNAKNSKKGEDRTPAWRWLGYLYHDSQFVSIPSDNLMRCFMEAGAMIPVPGAKGSKTFKSQSQSGMAVTEPYWTLNSNGKPIAMGDINELMKEESFLAHRQRVSSLGFSLFVKRARVTSSKHVRVRPRFDNWSAVGTLSVWDPQVDDRVVNDIVAYAGQYKGLGDWRPGSKTPGSFGIFTGEVKRLS